MPHASVCVKRKVFARKYLKYVSKINKVHSVHPVGYGEAQQDLGLEADIARLYQLLSCAVCQGARPLTHSLLYGPKKKVVGEAGAICEIRVIYLVILSSILLKQNLLFLRDPVYLRAC